MRLSNTTDRIPGGVESADHVRGIAPGEVGRRRRPSGRAEVVRVRDVLVLVGNLERRRDDRPRERVDERHERARPAARGPRRRLLRRPPRRRARRIASTAASAAHIVHVPIQPAFEPAAALGDGARHRPPRLAAGPVPADGEASLHLGAVADDLRRVGDPAERNARVARRCARTARASRSPAAAPDSGSITRCAVGVRRRSARGARPSPSDSETSASGCQGPPNRPTTRLTAPASGGTTSPVWQTLAPGSSTVENASRRVSSTPARRGADCERLATSTAPTTTAASSAPTSTPRPPDRTAGRGAGPPPASVPPRARRHVRRPAGQHPGS